MFGSWRAEMISSKDHVTSDQSISLVYTSSDSFLLSAANSFAILRSCADVSHSVGRIMEQNLPTHHTWSKSTSRTNPRTILVENEREHRKEKRDTGNKRRRPVDAHLCLFTLVSPTLRQ